MAAMKIANRIAAKNTMTKGEMKSTHRPLRSGTSDAYVSFGDSRTPMKRAGRLFGAGGTPATGDVVVLGLGWKKAIVLRTLRAAGTKSFPTPSRNSHAE